MSLSDVTAFILCGGLGTRLRSVVTDRPKSMAMIGVRPFLEIQLLQLRAQEINRVVLGTGYLSEQIESYFHDGSALDMKISYSREPEPLGTGGAIRLAAGEFSDPVMILNGDSFCECDLAALLNFYNERQADFVMVTRPVKNANRYGRVKADAGGRLIGFEEKSTAEASGLINTGIYLCSSAMIEAIPSGRPVSLEREIIPTFLEHSCHAFETSGLFIDIGVPDDYMRAQTLLASVPKNS